MHMNAANSATINVYGNHNYYCIGTYTYCTSKCVCACVCVRRLSPLTAYKYIIENV